MNGLYRLFRSSTHLTIPRSPSTPREHHHCRVRTHTRSERAREIRSLWLTILLAPSVRLWLYGRLVKGARRHRQLRLLVLLVLVIEEKLRGMKHYVRTGVFRGAQVLRTSSERARRRQGGTKNRQIMVVIPGNPGLADFYARFCSELGKGDDNVDVHCVGHRNHIGQPRDALVTLNCAYRCTVLDKELREKNLLFRDDVHELVSLESQIDHHKAYIENVLLRDNRDVDLVVVGHSIGAWIANEALQRALPHVDTKIRSLQLVLLMPFLEADFTQPRQRFIHFASSISLLCRIAQILVWLMRVLLPTTLRRALFARFLKPTMCDTSISLVAMASSPSFIANCLHLVRDEFIALQRQPDGRGVWVTTLRDVQNHRFRQSKTNGLRTKIAFLFAKDDDWSPSDMMTTVKNTFDDDDDVTVHYDDSLSHSFCTNEREASRCAAWIRGLL